MIPNVLISLVSDKRLLSIVLKLYLSVSDFLMESWVSGLNHLPAKKAIAKSGSQVQILYSPQNFLG